MDVSTEIRSLQSSINTNVRVYHSGVGIGLVEEAAVGVELYSIVYPQFFLGSIFFVGTTQISVFPLAFSRAQVSFCA